MVASFPSQCNGTLSEETGTSMLWLMVDSALRSSSSMEAIEDVRDREDVVVVDYTGSYHVERSSRAAAACAQAALVSMSSNACMQRTDR